MENDDVLDAMVEQTGGGRGGGNINGQSS